MTGSSSARRRGPAPTRSVDEIVAAAVARADTGGLAAATIRAVAADLGTAPASLYRYLPSHEALVEAMVEAALATVPPTPATGELVADLATWTAAQVAVLRRHPWLVETMPSVPPGPAAIRLLDGGLVLIGDAGAGGAARLETLAMLTGTATLFARASVTPSARTVEAMTRAAADHPALAAAFTDPGTPADQDELLRRTVAGIVQGVLAPT